MLCCNEPQHIKSEAMFKVFRALKEGGLSFSTANAIALGKKDLTVLGRFALRTQWMFPPRTKSEALRQVARVQNLEIQYIGSSENVASDIVDLRGIPVYFDEALSADPFLREVLMALALDGDEFPS